MNALTLPYSTTAPWPGQDDGVAGRQMRGLAIAAVCHIERIRIGYRVPSQSGNGSYVVIPSDDAWMCSCPDYETRAMDCKHSYAVQYAMQRDNENDDAIAGPAPSDKTKGAPELELGGLDGAALTAPVRTLPKHFVGVGPGASQKGMVLATAERARPTYAQNWPAYNLAQKNEKHYFRHLLRDLSALSEETEADMGRKPLPMADRIFSLVYKTYTGSSWRRFDTDLREARAAGFIETAASTTALARYMDDQDLTPILHDLIICSALPLRPFEHSFSIDGTGFSTSRFDRWFDEKWGKGTATRDWAKLHLICGNATHVITCAEVSDRRDHDSRYFEPLVEQTAEYFDLREVAADKAYLSRKHQMFVDGLGAVMFSPFKSNTVAPRLDDRSAWARMYHNFMADYDGWARHYHQRSNVETAIAMVKRLFGDSLCSRNVVAQCNELLCKVLAHNLRMIVHAMYEMGLDPEFRPLP